MSLSSWCIVEMLPIEARYVRKLSQILNDCLIVIECLGATVLSLLYPHRERPSFAIRLVLLFLVLLKSNFLVRLTILALWCLVLLEGFIWFSPCSSKTDLWDYSIDWLSVRGLISGNVVGLQRLEWYLSISWALVRLGYKEFLDILGITNFLLVELPLLFDTSPETLLQPSILLSDNLAELALYSLQSPLNLNVSQISILLSL